MSESHQPGFPPPPLWPAPPRPSQPVPKTPAPLRDIGRRRFLQLVGVGGVAAVTGGTTGWIAGRQTNPAAATTTAAAAVRSTSNTLTASNLDVAAIAALIEPSVVSITADVTTRRGGRTLTGTAAGTGIVLSSTGDIVTNAHVIDGASNIQITVVGSSQPQTATLVASDTAADLALLRVQDPQGLAPAPLGTLASVAVGDDVVAIGNALALDGGPTVTRGIVSALNRSIDTTNGTLQGLIQTDAAISSGNSGGPLVNASGEVIGINAVVAASSGTTQAENIGFAINIDTVQNVVAQLRKKTT